MFGDDEELKELRKEWPNLSYNEKVDKFLWKMVWFHHTKHISGSPSQPINELTKTLEESSKSSQKLTESIRNATRAAAIIGGLGVLVAIVNLVRDIWF